LARSRTGKGKFSDPLPATQTESAGLELEVVNGKNNGVWREGVVVVDMLLGGMFCFLQLGKPLRPRLPKLRQGLLSMLTALKIEDKGAFPASQTPSRDTKPPSLCHGSDNSVNPEMGGRLG